MDTSRAGQRKMNVDGALNEQIGVYGMRAVIWNKQGQAVAAMACKGEWVFTSGGGGGL